MDHNIKKMIDQLVDNGDLQTLSALTPDQKAYAKGRILEGKVVKAREDLYTFVRLMASVIIPDKFQDGAHIHVICSELQQMCEDLEWQERNQALHYTKRKKPKKPRVQVFLPPRSMKSKLCSNLFPAWCIGRNPHWQVIAVGNSVKFAEDNLSVLTKNIVDTDEYRLIFPEVELRKGSKAKGNWGTTKGGNFFAAGAGSAIAGRGANLTICDDVLSEQSAYSDTERTAINNWYLGGLRTRLSASGGGELIVNTRWHMDDLSAHMLKVDEESEYKWKVISIPAILDEAGAKILGKKEGESYWPEVWSLDDLHSKKATFPSSHWAALYMQNPVPDEGSIIKEEWIQYWDDDEPPAVDYVVTSMDTAYSKSEQADYTAITTWGVFFTKEIGLRGKEEVVSNLILLEAKKDKMSFGELLDECQDIKDRIDPDLFIIEKKSSGQSLIQELQLAKFPLHEYLPEKGKLERVYACETIFRAGRIYIPKGKYWTKDFVTELVHFPYAPHDDFVDSTSQAIIWMRHNLQMPHEYEIGYDSFQEEDDDVYRPKETRSYWGSL